ncbi:MAG: endonuclease III [Verrucomicrobiae bacterium]|nr:endonuclease III [Verrucomicrobiae bacterium]
MQEQKISEIKERIKKITEILAKTYPNAHCELNHKNPLELLVATILSARCTDKQVNIVTEELFKKYKNAADYANANPEEFANDIKRIGMYKNKAKAIQSACKTLIEKYGGKVPKTMDELTQLAGVGRKTANVVLGNAYGINSGIVVDTHVVRLSERLGFTKEKNPEKIELDLMALVPQKDWTMFSHWIIWHGRRRCYARNPDCENCEIKQLCPSAGKFSKKTTKP